LLELRNSHGLTIKYFGYDITSSKRRLGIMLISRRHRPHHPAEHRF